MKTIDLASLPTVKASHGDFFKKVMIDEGEVPHISTFAQVTLEPGQTASEHGHDGMYEVFLIERGKMKLIVNGEDEYTLEQGSCIITEPHETHEVNNPYSEPLVITYFQSKA